MEQAIAILRAEAESCRQSSMGNGEYNISFWTVAIVLESLAKRLEALAVEQGQ